MNTQSNKARARAWVNGYVVAGTSIVIAAVFPGATSVALITMEIHMCYQIGKIYRGDKYSNAEAVAAAGVVGLAAVTAKLAALEALNFIPFAGWAAKGVIAAGVIKGLGEAIIAHYEKAEKQEASRDSTDQRKLESLLQIYGINREIITLGFTTPELFQILHGKKADPILERHYLQLWFNQFALIHSFHRRKFFPPDMRESLEQDIRDFLAQENMQHYWLHNRIYYPESFQTFVDNLSGPKAGVRKKRPPKP